jgi:hypothetical protein
MTAKLGSSPCDPTARRRTQMLTLATAAAIALSATLGASTSRADIGSVYFDASLNAAAGNPDRLFNPTLTGFSNVGLGAFVMPNLTTGSNNVATGTGALFANTTGSENVATGYAALSSNTTGSENVATGDSALRENTTGDNNVALGFQAGQNLTTGSNNVAIANPGIAGESGTIRIGVDQSAAYIAGISGTALDDSAEPVVIDANGRLGTAPELADSVASLTTSVASLQGSMTSVEGSVASLTTSVTSLRTSVQRLNKKVKRQQRQIKRLRRQVKGG